MLILALFFHYHHILMIVISDCQDCGFDDLGVLLFGGIISAVMVALLFSLIRLRLQGKKESPSESISISPSKQNKSG